MTTKATSDAGLVEPYQPPAHNDRHPKDGYTAGVLVLQALHDAGRALTTPELKERIPRSDRQVDNALLSLRRSGLVAFGRPPSKGRGGWPPCKYRLRPAAEDFLNSLVSQGIEIGQTARGAQ